MKAVLIHAPVPILYIGAYGNEAFRTPALDRLAAEGIVFDAHETDGGSPEQFLQILLSGRHAFAARLEDPPILLAQLNEAGAVATLFSNRGTPPAGNWTLAHSLPGEYRMTPIAEAIAALLDRLDDQPHWLLVLDLCRLEDDQPEEPSSDEPLAKAKDAVGPADESDEDADLSETQSESAEDDSDLEESPEDVSATEADDEDEGPEKEDLAEPLEEELEDPDLQLLLEGQGETAADVEDFDMFVGWLRAELAERGVWDEVALIFTGQGDSARPDGLCSVGPDHPLRPSLSRLPLIVRLPAQAHAGRRVAALTQPADLTSTVSSWLRQSPAANHGSSLAPLCEGLTQASRDYVCAAVSHGDSQALALTSSAWKYMLLSNPEREPRHWLFRQPEDRFGRMDLYQQKLDFAERLESCLLSYIAAAKLDGPFAAPELPSEEPPTNPELLERKEA